MFKRLRDARPEWRGQLFQAAWLVCFVIAAVVIGGDDLASRVEFAAFFLGAGGTGLLFFRRKTDRLARNLFFAAAGTWVLAMVTDAAAHDSAGNVAIGIAGTALTIGVVGAIIVVVRGLRDQPETAAEGEGEVPDGPAA